MKNGKEVYFKVLCVNKIDNSNFITIGKFYNVFYEYNSHYEIINDLDYRQLYQKSLFLTEKQIRKQKLLKIQKNLPEN